MKQSVRFVLTLVLCLVLSLSGVLVGIPALRAADTGIWTQLPLFGVDVYSLVIDPLTPTTLYAGGESVSDSSIAGVFRSTDGGDTWAFLNSGLIYPNGNNWYHFAPTFLAINPVVPSTIYAGFQIGVCRTTDSGNTWQALNLGSLMVDVYSLAIDSTNPEIVYAGSWSSCYRSKDGGESWIKLNSELSLHEGAIRSIVVDPVTPAILYAAMDGIESGHVFRSADSGDTWTVVGAAWATAGNADFAAQSVECLAINPVTPTTLYAGTNYSGGWGQVFRSADSGATWTNLNIGGSSTVYSLAIDPAAPSILYAAGGGVLRSTDSGTSWSRINTGLTNTSVQYLAINPIAPSILYAAGPGGVFRYDAASLFLCSLTTTASPSAGGTIAKSPDAPSYTPGTVVTLTATPATGYTFTGWSGSLTGATNPATITMDADKTVTATFTSSTTGSGDTNGDGIVNTLDVLLAARAAAGLGAPLTGSAFLAADVNHDGIINVLDVLLIAQIVGH